VKYHHGEEALEKALVEKQYSPYVGRSYPTRVLWGDQHFHTQIYAGTLNRVSQEDAYRFARGEEVRSTTGVRAKLSRPLDWLVISDHAEMYGLMPQLLKGDPDILATEVGKRWYEMLNSGDKETVLNTVWEIIGALNEPDSPFENDTAGRGRQAAAGRQHRRRQKRQLDQHHRIPRAYHGLEGSRVRSEATRFLLRPGNRDPDTALDCIRSQTLWH
jgi:hypothetical protein